MVKKLSCVSCGSLKRFPHTFTTCNQLAVLDVKNKISKCILDSNIKTYLAKWQCKVLKAK